MRIPVIAVLGNHDYESGQQAELSQMLAHAGVHMLDGDTFETHGIGFAGVKGFAGGFGRGTLGAWGEPVVKNFVEAAVQEALKLEGALAKLRTEHRMAVLHYAPIVATVEGEPLEIYPWLGWRTSGGAAQPVLSLLRRARPRARWRTRRAHFHRDTGLQCEHAPAYAMHAGGNALEALDADRGIHVAVAGHAAINHLTGGKREDKAEPATGSQRDGSEQGSCDERCDTLITPHVSPGGANGAAWATSGLTSRPPWTSGFLAHVVTLQQGKCLWSGTQGAVRILDALQRFSGRLTDARKVAHLPARPRAALAVEMEAHATHRKRALPRGLPIRPDIAQQVVNGARNGDVRRAERQAAYRPDELLELTRQARALGLVEGVVRTRRELIDDNTPLARQEKLHREQADNA